MPNFLGEIYEDLKSAYQAVLTGVSDGSRVVRYKIGDRWVDREPSNDLLAELGNQIEKAEKQLNRANSPTFRVATISRPSRSA